MTRIIHQFLGALPYPFYVWYHLGLRRWRASDAAKVSMARDLALLDKLGRPKTVLSGPFAGMWYPRWSHGSALLPKFVGAYEEELHGVIERVPGMGVSGVVDIGAAEGYYAVGLARRFDLPIVAFELNPRARALLDQMARHNRVAHLVDIEGACTTESLERALAARPRSLVICDCEGAEGTLLDPDVVPSLRGAHILVERHDAARPGVSALIRRRFEPTHVVEDIAENAQKHCPELPATRGLTEAERRQMVDERRGSLNEWFFMVPR